MRENPLSSLSDEAYRILKGEILENRFTPGSQASEKEMVERFGLSRTPVREALLRLREEGLIEILPRRGFRVLPLSVSDVREIQQVSKALELEAAVILAQSSLTEEQITELDAAIVEMEEAIEQNDREKWTAADRRFHLGVVERCGNQRLFNAFIDLFGLSNRARSFALYVREMPVQSTKEHRQMLDAILAGDIEAVQRLYRQHWERTTEELLEIVAKHNRTYF